MSWQDLFSEKTIRRGEEIFRAGRVTELFLIGPDIYQISVRDRSRHTVILRYMNGEPADLSCTCETSRKGFTCSHMAAALISLEERKAEILTALQPKISDHAVIHPFRKELDNSSYFRFHEITEDLQIHAGEYREALALYQNDQPELDSVRTGYKENTGPLSEQILEARGLFANGTEVFFSCERSRLLQLSCNNPHCYPVFQTSLTASYPRRPICSHQIAFLLKIRDLLHSSPVGDRTTKGTRAWIRQFQNDPCFFSGAFRSSVRLLPRLIIRDRSLFLGFRICTFVETERSFVVPSVTGLINAVHTNDLYQPLSSIPAIDFSRNSFHSESLPLFQLLSEMAGHLPLKANSRALLLSGLYLDQLFSMFAGQTLECLNHDSSVASHTISLDEGILPGPVLTVRPVFDPSQKAVEAVSLSGLLPPVFCGMEHTYFLQDDSLIRLDKESAWPFDASGLLRKLSDTTADGHLDLVFGRNHLVFFFRHLFPCLQSLFPVNEIDTERLRELLPPAADFVLTLDLDQGLPVCRIQAAYGNLRFGLPEDATEGQDPLRDVFLEKHLMEAVRHFFPETKPDSFACQDETDSIFGILRDGPEALHKETRRLMESLFSESRIEIRQSEDFGWIRIPRHLSFQVDLQAEKNTALLIVQCRDVLPGELWYMIQCFRGHKPYARLENGLFYSFGEEISLISELLRIQQISREIFESSCVSGFAGTRCILRLPLGRAFSVDALLKNAPFPYQKDPESARLSEYLETGTESSVSDWLYARVSCGFGAILAFDICLDKRLPVIEILQKLHQHSTLPSLIICPSALTLFWQDLIHSCSEDVLITSFQALQENEAAFRDLRFRCKIIDSFYFIQDPRSRIAETVGQVRAEAKIVLTDPSMISRPGDLKMLFGFAMDDYLFDSSPIPDELTVPFIRQMYTADCPDLPPIVSRTIRIPMEENTAIGKTKACRELILSAVRAGHQVLVLSDDPDNYPLLRKELRKVYINSICPGENSPFPDLPGLVAFSGQKRFSPVSGKPDIVLFYDPVQDPETILKVRGLKGRDLEGLPLSGPLLAVFLAE
ncbi:MAG: SNF2 helicase associated domain-containing protein [Firmicutes bacterium]|nr:SNF2 helicase associated domain-containing protein [Bacillota bacterium]